MQPLHCLSQKASTVLSPPTLAPSRLRPRLPLHSRPSNRPHPKSPSPSPNTPSFTIPHFNVFNFQFSISPPPTPTNRLTTGVGRRKAAFRGMTVDPLVRQRGTESGLRRCSTLSPSGAAPPPPRPPNTAPANPHPSSPGTPTSRSAPSPSPLRTSAPQALDCCKNYSSLCVRSTPASHPQVVPVHVASLNMSLRAKTSKTVLHLAHFRKGRTRTRAPGWSAQHGTRRAQQIGR
ncbi:MAG: hypothetical protein DVB22_000827 [Verrucomicrobia bacterium]|jgi:hypothetical protein|nr:MAG: hypothetical protein DVB22_000827 [Verrucomicrobiota bacterium]